MARVFIVGSGVVGTATGKGFALHGHSVAFVDVNPQRIDVLRSAGFSASGTIDLAGAPAFIFLTLPTPHVGCRYDLEAFELGTIAVGHALRASSALHTVVVRSTVPPGTCENLVVPLLERASGRTAGDGFAIASNPEFLRAASASEDFLTPWMTVIGSRSRRTIERLVQLYQPFGGSVRTFPDPAEAELVKCAHNLYNATKISFWNEMWTVATRLGVNPDRVASTVAYSAEGSVNPEYGIEGGRPFGGACLPKDTKGFLGFAAELGLQMPLLAGVVAVNEAIAEAIGLAAAGSDVNEQKAANGRNPRARSPKPENRTNGNGHLSPASA